MGARRQQRVVVALAQGQVDFDAKNLLRDAVPAHREHAGVNPQLAAVGGAHLPVARRLRFAAAPQLFDGGGKLGLARAMRDDGGGRPAQRQRGRRAVQLGTRAVPEAQHAGPVETAHGHLGRAFQRPDQARQQFQRISRRPGAVRWRRWR